MTHESEFPERTPSVAELRERAAKAKIAAAETAACYARVFLGDDDGKRVWADLCAKFGMHRLVFNVGQGGRFDTIAAALIEGERHVISEITNALKLGAPGQALKNLT